eukprot:CAMPEP_0181347120 /NCGR_PEP_ID=MMETSP1101-20121128/33710_1 /TAXON_ID=46948 /ORGANISM="Rhodomonas abbreviata, Strain Caron Lab Isolate" /LENGTH=107 /DNA_ID=CAMNT_0023459315 /DNA_START=32 /DNA_END=355 /DNA_ORIENTATION=+
MSLQERIEAIIAIENKEERQAARKELISTLKRPEIKEAKAIFASLKGKAAERRKAKKQGGGKPHMSKEERMAMREKRKAKKEAAKAEADGESPVSSDSTGTSSEDEE